MQHGESFAVSSCLNIRNLGPEPVALRAGSKKGRMFLRTTWLGRDTAQKYTCPWCREASNAALTHAAV